MLGFLIGVVVGVIAGSTTVIIILLREVDKRDGK